MSTDHLPVLIDSDAHSQGCTRSPVVASRKEVDDARNRSPGPQLRPWLTTGTG